MKKEVTAVADEKVLRPKSFRLDDETADKFRKIGETIGANQQETLERLIQAYELQIGKSNLTEKKADMEKFESYIAILNRMYMASLEDNQHITDVVSFPSFQIREKWEIKGLDLLVEPILEDGVIGRLVNVNGLLSVYDFGRINTGVNDIIDI
jgi:hypothetical protein